MRQLVYCDGLWSPRGDWESDLGLWRSDDIVEVLEARGTIPFLWEAHYNRMIAACYCDIPLEKLPPESEILKQLRMLLTENGFTYSVIHMLVTPGLSLDLKTPLFKPTLTLDVRRHEIQNVSPLSLKTVSERRNFPQYKLGSSYGNIGRIRAKYKIKEEGFDSFLYWDERDGILEGPYENLFFVTKDRELVTPASGVLRGVTRGIILYLARNSGFFKSVSESPNIHISFLKECKEAFLTSTTKGTAPIKQINDYKHFMYGNKTFVAKLRKLFLRYRDKYYKDKENFCNTA